MSIGWVEEQIVLYTAVSALARMADIKSMDYLVTLLEHGIPSMEAPIIQAMEKVINQSYGVSLKKVEKKILPVNIIPLLHHDNKEARRSAIVLSGLLRINEAVPDLCRLYTESNSDLFVELNEAIGRIDPQEISPLLEILASPGKSHSVKAAAVNLIGQLNTEGAFVLLAPWLDRVADELRVDIAEVCTRLSSCPGAFISSLLADRLVAIRRIAVEALAKDDDPVILRQLLKMVDDPAAEVRLAAARSLSGKDLSGHRQRLTSLLQSANIREKIFCLTMMPASLAADFSQSILKCCSDIDPLVRGAAVTCAAYLPETVWREGLETALGDSEDSVRLAAIRAIGKRAAPGLAERLLTIARTDQADWNQYEAVQVIGRLGLKEVAEQLIPLFADTHNLARAAILDVLGTMHAPGGRELAKSAVNSEDELVREAAENLLQKTVAATGPVESRS
jgi:HEAT repeat protein